MRHITILFFSVLFLCVKGLNSFHLTLSRYKQFLGQTTAAPNYSCSENGGNVKFTASSSPHSASYPTSNCSLQQCIVSSSNNDSCRSSLTPCFDYRSLDNSSYCAPGILCSILEACDNITYTCTPNTSVCIVNSCCSSHAICLPLLSTNFCTRGIDTLYSNLSVLINQLEYAVSISVVVRIEFISRKSRSNNILPQSGNDMIHKPI